jgi:hypothetical protein
MGRLDGARTIEDLVALTLNDIPGQVDALVDAYLVGADSGQFCLRRAELALGFLDAAPFSELSYRIWRRIAGEDQDEHEDDKLPYQSSSMQFMPPVEFQIER